MRNGGVTSCELVLGGARRRRPYGHDIKGSDALRVVITNQVALNGGDAAILHGMAKVLRLSFGNDVQMVVLDRQAAAAQKYHPDFHFRQMHLAGPSASKGRALHRLLSRSKLVQKLYRARSRFAAGRAWAGFLLPREAKANYRDYRTADLIASTGGTYLVEHYDISANLNQIELAVSSGVPTIMYTQSLGPFQKARNRRRLSKILPMLRLVLLRDERSLANLQELDLPLNNVRRLADAAFALTDPDTLDRAARRQFRSRPEVAISVRFWNFSNLAAPTQARERYMAAVGQAVVHLVRSRGARVTFISTCQGTPEYWLDDSATATEIVATLPPDIAQAIRVDREFHSPGELLSLLAGFDLVIATRMHMAILALCAGSPVVPIAYEFKTAELFSNMGFPDVVQDIENISGEALCAVVDRCLDRASADQERLMNAVLAQHQSALSVVSELASLTSRGR